MRECGVPLVGLPAGRPLRVRALRILACKNQRLIRKAVGCSCLKLGTPKVENRTQFHNFWLANIVNLYCIVGATGQRLSTGKNIEYAGIGLEGIKWPITQ